MNPAPTHCMVCGAAGVPRVWNSLAVLLCPACGFAWRAAFDIPERYYTDVNLERSEPGEGKAASRIRNAESRIAALRPFLPVPGICDVGCGDGSFLIALRDAGYERCWGIEPSLYACKLAWSKRLEVVQGDLTMLQQAHAGRETNALTLFHVIEHVPDPLQTLGILHDALKPGGIVVLETPDGEAPLQRVTDHKNALVYYEHLTYWTESTIRTVLERAGFRVVSVTRRSFDWRHAPIRASLLRLGLRRDSRPAAAAPAVPQGGVKTSPKPARKGVLRAWAGSALARLVHVLQRDDYLLVVAERI